MNKKLLIALVLQLMLMPMVSFAYAHWYATVTKTIKMHVGTVEADIKQWHIDATNTYDADCDGIIAGDEITVENVLDADGQVIGVRIKVDPIFPCWFIEFKMLIHNKGRLVLGMDSETVVWGGPYTTDPCWDPLTPPGPVPSGFQYTNDLYLHDPGIVGCPKPCLDKTHYTIRVEPTTFILKPCECVMVKEYIHFVGQDYPDYQCHWFKLYKELKFREWIGPTWGSYGWTD